MEIFETQEINDDTFKVEIYPYDKEKFSRGSLKIINDMKISDCYIDKIDCFQIPNGIYKFVLLKNGQSIQT